MNLLWLRRGFLAMFQVPWQQVTPRQMHADDLKCSLAMNLRGRWGRRRQTAMQRLSVDGLSSEGQWRLHLASYDQLRPDESTVSPRTHRAGSTADGHGCSAGQRWNRFYCTSINPCLTYRVLCRGPAVLSKVGPACKQRVHLRCCLTSSQLTGTG